jgi:plastocyanin
MNAVAVLRFTCALLMMVALCSIGRNATAANIAVPKGAKVYRVEIHNFAFEPRTLTIPTGAYVVWTNRDEEPHVITSAGALFESSKGLDTGDTHTVAFSRPGTYAYYCSIHPMMVGTIIVK